MRCPIHGEVEGLMESEGALSNAYPFPVLCEECSPSQTIIGYENEHGQETDSLGDLIGERVPDGPAVRT
jgi:hypothetical protein